MGEPVRILIADDHPVVRFGLTQMLNAEPDFAVVGEASDAHEVVAKIRTLKADVTVLDMEMGEAHGVDALRALRVQEGLDPVRPGVVEAHDVVTLGSGPIHRGAKPHRPKPKGGTGCSRFGERGLEIAGHRTIRFG